MSEVPQSPADGDLHRRLLRLVDIMKSSNRLGVPMHVWAEDITAVESAAADVALLDQVTNNVKARAS